MNKSELIEAFAKAQDLPTATAASIMNTIVDTMVETLAKGDNIELRGFGSFTIKNYDPYTGRNPKTGKETFVKAKKLPVFKVGKELREAINANREK
jgi:integration host factor subunit beta